MHPTPTPRRPPRRRPTPRRAALAMLFALPVAALLVPRAAAPRAGAAEAAVPDLGTDAQRQTGEAVYEKWCSQCHGDQGDGQGIAAGRLLPPPRDFTTGKYKFRSTRFGALPTDDDLRRTLRNGLPYTGMPAFPELTGDEVEGVIAYLKTFSPRFQDPRSYAEPIDIPKPPAYDAEHAADGFQTFVEIGCARCHGEEGRGDGPSAPALRDDWGSFVRVADLTMPWTFRGGATREDLYRTISTGINGTPMAGFSEEALPPEKKWQIVDWIVSQAGGEGGEAPYTRMVSARPVEGDIALDANLEVTRELFADAPRAMFPVIGQVMEPGRDFHPAARAVEVRAIVNREEIAFLVEWHDMTATTGGENRPDLSVTIADETAGIAGAAGGAAAEEEVETDVWGQPIEPQPAEEPAEPAGGSIFDVVEESAAGPAIPESPWSDALAVQLPSELRPGVAKPYFLFGDAGYPVELWHVDLAQPAKATVWEGRGSQALTRLDREPPEMVSGYSKGRWSVAFKRPRDPEAGVRFAEESFVPIAFSVWDGFHSERGNRRGLTAWYHVYVPPLEKPSPVGPMLRAGFGVLALELLVIGWVRRRARRPTQEI